MNFKVAVCSATFLASALSAPAFADLAGDFQSQEANGRARDSQRSVSEIYASASEIAKNIGKSPVVSGPEKRSQGDRAELWYYGLASGRTCVVPVAIDGSGRPIFAFAITTRCTSKNGGRERSFYSE